MPFKYVLDRIWCNDVTQISECALDSVIAPGDILHSHAYHQFGDLLRNGGRPGPFLG